jgi:hypothetical protein
LFGACRNFLQVFQWRLPQENSPWDDRSLFTGKSAKGDRRLVSDSRDFDTDSTNRFSKETDSNIEDLGGGVSLSIPERQCKFIPLKDQPNPAPTLPKKKTT